MRVIFQRVTSASVTVDNTIVGEIRQGAILLLGIHETDTKAQADLLAKKCAEMRVFSDSDDRTLSWCMIFLMCCWILIARILLRIFASIHLWYWPVVFFSFFWCGIFVRFWY